MVDEDGKPQNPKIIRALGYGLDEEALKVVMKYRFMPALDRTGKPIAVMITIEVDDRFNYNFQTTE